MNEEPNVFFTKERMLYCDKMLGEESEDNFVSGENIYNTLFNSSLFNKPLHIKCLDCQLLVMVFFLSIHIINLLKII